MYDQQYAAEETNEPVEEIEQLTVDVNTDLPVLSSDDDVADLDINHFDHMDIVYYW